MALASLKTVQWIYSADWSHSMHSVNEFDSYIFDWIYKNVVINLTKINVVSIDHFFFVCCYGICSWKARFAHGKIVIRVLHQRALFIN